MIKDFCKISIFDIDYQSENTKNIKVFYSSKSEFLYFFSERNCLSELEQKLHPIDVQITREHIETFTITKCSSGTGHLRTLIKFKLNVITIRLPVVKQAVSEYDNNASNLNSNDLEDNILNKIPVDINITRQ